MSTTLHNRYPRHAQMPYNTGYWFATPPLCRRIRAHNTGIINAARPSRRVLRVDLRKITHRTQFSLRPCNRRCTIVPEPMPDFATPPIVASPNCALLRSGKVASMVYTDFQRNWKRVGVRNPGVYNLHSSFLQSFSSSSFGIFAMFRYRSESSASFVIEILDFNISSLPRVAYK